MVIASYTASSRGLLLYVAGTSPIGGAVVGLIVFSTRGPGAVHAVFFAIILAIAAFNVYYFGFRQVYLVELTPTELRWRSVLRRGAAPLADVRSIRRAKQSTRGGTVDVAIVEFASRGRLKFLARNPGASEFLAKIHETAPQVTVEAPIS